MTHGGKGEKRLDMLKRNSLKGNISSKKSGESDILYNVWIASEAMSYVPIVDSPCKQILCMHQCQRIGTKLYMLESSIIQVNV